MILLRSISQDYYRARFLCDTVSNGAIQILRQITYASEKRCHGILSFPAYDVFISRLIPCARICSP